jgi:hypothetical protein
MIYPWLKSYNRICFPRGMELFYLTTIPDDWEYMWFLYPPFMMIISNYGSIATNKIFIGLTIASLICMKGVRRSCDNQEFN